jgi:hypothetical protein
VSRRFGRVDILATRAIEFDRFLVGDVCESDGYEGGRVAEYARAAAKVGFLVLVDHFVEPARGEDEAGVDESVEVSRRCFDGVSRIVWEIFF